MNSPSVSQTNPKRRTSQELRDKCWFNYYAGYAPEFVQNTLNRFDLSPDAVVLDPWNGSGTTATVARRSGFQVYGYDLNPIMAIVAKARLLDIDSVSESLESLCNNILQQAKKTYRSSLKSSHVPEDPLCVWFESDSVAIWRSIEFSIRRIYMAQSFSRCRLPYLENQGFNHWVSATSPLAAFFYTALFRTIRSEARERRSSNPTWNKKPRNEDELLRSSLSYVESLFSQQVTELTSILAAEATLCRENFRIQSNANQQNCAVVPTIAQVEVACSTRLPLPSASVHAIITSPPYCTRIDYAVLTVLELALLGVNKDQFKALRQSLIGTTTVPREQPTFLEQWGIECLSFLKKVENHDSHASKSYYLKNLTDYYAKVHSSLTEAERVMAPGARYAIVVQDSFYKDIHNDLPLIVKQMGENLGWRCEDEQVHLVSHTLAGVNPRVKTYRQHSGAAEKVLFFVKPV